MCDKKEKETKRPPIIMLPEDETRRRQLLKKLSEYRERLRQHPFDHPGRQMDVICKKTVLERLFRFSQVDTWTLSCEMAKTYENSFDISAFNNACGVIEDYCKTGGQNVRKEGIPTNSH